MKVLSTTEVQNVSGGGWLGSGSSQGFYENKFGAPQYVPNNVGIKYTPDSGNGLGFSAGRAWDQSGSSSTGSVSIHANGFFGSIHGVNSGGRMVDGGFQLGFSKAW